MSAKHVALHWQPLTWLLASEGLQETNPTFMFDGLQSIQSWAYLVIVVSVIFEGPIATLLAATAASTGYLHPVGVFVAAAIGNTIADVLWYLLGYAGNLQSLSRFRWLRLRPELVERIEREITNNAHRMLFIAKLTLGLVIPTLVATGLARVSWRRWFWALVLAECVWTGGLVTAGYFWGAYLQQLDQGLRYAALGGSVLFIIIASVYVARWHERNLRSSGS